MAPNSSCCSCYNTKQKYKCVHAHARVQQPRVQSDSLSALWYGVLSTSHDFFFFMNLVVDTHIVLADLTDEVLGFMHGSRCWSEHRESLLVHLIYCHTLKRSQQISSFNIVLQSLSCIADWGKKTHPKCTCFCRVSGWFSDSVKYKIWGYMLPVWACSLRRL